MHRFPVFIVVAAQKLDFTWKFDNTETSNEIKTCREQIRPPKKKTVYNMGEKKVEIRKKNMKAGINLKLNAKEERPDRDVLNNQGATFI